MDETNKSPGPSLYSRQESHTVVKAYTEDCIRGWMKLSTAVLEAGFPKGLVLKILQFRNGEMPGSIPGSRKIPGGE